MDYLALNMIGVGTIVTWWGTKTLYHQIWERWLEITIISLSRIGQEKAYLLPEKAKRIRVECECFDGYNPKISKKILEFVSEKSLETELGRIVGLLMTSYDLSHDHGKTASLLTATCYHLNKPKDFFLGLNETNPILAKWWIDSPIPPPIKT